jgi:hypothetical protein
MPSSIFNHNKQHPQQTKLERKLHREYSQLVNTAMKMERSRKHTPEQIRAFFDEMFERQSQIIKELEACTGNKIHQIICTYNRINKYPNTKIEEDRRNRKS